jgi:hypothetical protein
VGADEAQIDGVTAISGSGPAYVFHFIECLQASGEALGFDAATARKLAIDTVLGAARLAAGSDESPALRERVTSKGGTTAAALASLRRTVSRPSSSARWWPPKPAGASWATSSAATEEERHARQPSPHPSKPSAGFCPACCWRAS